MKLLHKVFPLLLWIYVPSRLAYGQYVPLNSLTISSLYQDKSRQENQSTTEKPWWTDLQEKREQFKAAKIRAQSLSFNNGKIINMKRPVDESEPSTNSAQKVTEYPRPITTSIPYEEDWPPGKHWLKYLVTIKNFQ